MTEALDHYLDQRDENYERREETMKLSKQILEIRLKNVPDGDDWFGCALSEIMGIIDEVIKLETEKDRRIYYQDIVYKVCNLLDKYHDRGPGTGLVCGTVEEPSNEVQDELATLLNDGFMNDVLLRGD